MSEQRTAARLTRGARRPALAVALFALVTALTLVDLLFVLLVPDTGSAASWGGGGLVFDLAFPLALWSFPLVGVLICRRRPENAVGWLLLAIGLAWGVANLTSYADYGVNLHPGSLPAASLVAVVASGMWLPAVGLTTTYLVLLFPNGHLLTRRWRLVAYLSGFAIVFGYLTLVLTPGPLADAGYPHTTNPLGIEALRGVAGPAKLGILLLPVSIALSAAGLVVRFRRSHGVERLQLTWLAAAAAAVAAIYVVVQPLSVVVAGRRGGAIPSWLLLAQDVALLSFALIPIAIGFAVLRYRLYEIDVIIRRTLVYGSLLVVLSAIYLGGLVLAGAALRSVTGLSSSLAVTLSTLAVAAAFQPLRRRIQRAVDRRFYRGSYDAALTLEAFSSRLREHVDLEAMRGEVVSVVHASLRPAHAALWLAPRAETAAPPVERVELG
jgi:hypothetical protein